MWILNQVLLFLKLWKSFKQSKKKMSPKLYKSSSEWNRLCLNPNDSHWLFGRNENFFYENKCNWSGWKKKWPITKRKSLSVFISFGQICTGVLLVFSILFLCKWAESHLHSSVRTCLCLSYITDYHHVIPSGWVSSSCFLQGVPDVAAPFLQPSRPL